MNPNPVTAQQTRFGGTTSPSRVRSPSQDQIQYPYHMTLNFILFIVVLALCIHISQRLTRRP